MVTQADAHVRGPLFTSTRTTDADNNEAQAPSNAEEVHEQIRKMKAHKAKRAKVTSYLLLLLDICRAAVTAMIAAACLCHGLFGGAAAIPAPNGGSLPPPIAEVLFFSLLWFSVLLSCLLGVCTILGRLLRATLCIAVRAIRWLFAAHENVDTCDAVPPNPQVLVPCLSPNNSNFSLLPLLIPMSVNLLNRQPWSTTGARPSSPSLLPFLPADAGADTQGSRERGY